MNDSEKLQQLRTRSIPRLLWDYSAPAVTGMLVTSLYNVIDRIYIGQGVGPEAIAGLGITFPVSNLSVAMGVLIGAGASARSSIMLGAGDMRSAERVLGNSLVLTLIIGTIYVGLFGLFIDPILYAFGASDVTIPYARDFMLWILPGMLMTNLCFNLNNIMRSSGYPMKAMVTMIIGAALNVVLAPIFIFGLDMGIKGSAIATDISMTVSLVFVLHHFFQTKSTLHFHRGIYALRRRIVYDIISIGAAPALVNAAACVITITVNNALKHYGNDLYIGAASIFITYTSFLTTFVIGLGIGMQPVVGYNYGACRYDRLKGAYGLAALTGTLICTVGSVVGLTCPRLIARVFTTDAGLIEVTASGMKVALVAFWMAGFQIISTNFFQSLGKVWQSILMGLLRQVVFMYPLLRWLPGIFGLKGVWMAFPISDALATVVTVVLIIWMLREINKLSKTVKPIADNMQPTD